jgi:hypothetical protein
MDGQNSNVRSMTGPEPNQSDVAVASALARFAQRTSRRSFLQRAGGALFGGLASAIFVDAIAMANPPPGLESIFNAGAADWHHCTDEWDRCKMCGFSCNCCNGGGDNPQDCPNCAEEDPMRQWWACCRNDSGGNRQIKYIDCTRGSCDNSKLTECYGCSGCTNGCTNPNSEGPRRHDLFWKQGGTYVCTTVNRIGPCPV